PGTSSLERLAPPGGALAREKPGLVAAGEEEVEHRVLLVRLAIGPTVVLVQVSGFAMLIDERDFGGAALDDVLRLEREGGSGGRRRWNLVRDLGKQQNEAEDRGKDGYFFHGYTVFQSIRSSGSVQAAPEVYRRQNCWRAQRNIWGCRNQSIAGLAVTQEKLRRR